MLRTKLEEKYRNIHSAFKGAEAEVLLFPGTKLVVVDSMDMGGDLFQVQLREIAVPVELIK